MKKNELEQLYVYLNDEINSIKSDYQRSGWTKWALLAAFATMFWMFLSVVETDQLDFNKVCYFLLLIIFFVDSSKLFVEIINGNDKGKNINRFFLTKDSLGDSRVTLLLSFIKYIFIIIILSNLKGDLSKVTSFSMSFIVYFFIVVLLLSFILSFTKLPLKVQLNYDKKKLVFYTLLIILYIISLIGLIRLWMFNLEWKSMDNFKVAILIFGMFYMLEILSKQERLPSTINSLYEIRRKIIFGAASYDIIKGQIEVTLLGHNVSTFFAPYIERYISNTDNYQKSMGEVNFSLQKLNSLLSQMEDKSDDVSLQKALEVRTLVDNHFKNATKYLDTIVKNEKSTEKMLKYFNILFPNETQSFEDIYLTIIREVEKMRNKSKEAHNNINKVVDNINRLNLE